MGPGSNGSQSRGDNEANINHVLLITVFNPHYPITCDIIHQVCNGFGKVNRIVIFKKNGVQAMVEFDNVASARRAKSALQGYEIYNGCCTLRVEYAKPTKLNIYKNDQDSFDYTNPNLGSGTADSVNAQQQQQQQAQPQQQQQQGGNHSHHTQNSSNSHPHNSQNHGHHSRNGPPLGHNHQHHYHPPHNQHHMHPVSSSPLQVGQSQQGGVSSNYQPHDQPQTEFHDSGVFNMSRSSQTSYGNVDNFAQNQYNRHDSHGRVGMPSHAGPYNANQPHHGHHSSLAAGPNYQQQGTVMMVYGLCPNRMNCDKLFNLFCLYGNVARVKFLKTKMGCAMVQMGDYIAVERCLSSLNKVTIFGNVLELSYSKQAFLHDVLQPYTLPDGSPSFKDFMGNKNNRFKNPEAANKNRILAPSSTLHFFNAPYGMTVEELSNLIVQTCENEPSQVKFFNPKNERNSSGLLTFKDVSEAIEALIMCNHLAIPRPGATHLHILRLCFSTPNNHTS